MNNDIPSFGMSMQDVTESLRGQCYDLHLTAVASWLYSMIQQRDAALAQLEQLKGIKPELPPFPLQGTGLPRYGIRWNGQKEPLTVPFDDGYWTPYHLALTQNAELSAQVEVLRSASAKAVNFIKNGVELGFIRMPDADCPDPAHGTLPALESALSVMPTQCLHQIQSGAFKAGFYKAKSVYNCELGQCSIALNEYVEEYADRVKRGEV